MRGSSYCGASGISASTSGFAWAQAAESTWASVVTWHSGRSLIYIGIHAAGGTLNSTRASASTVYRFGRAKQARRVETTVKEEPSTRTALLKFVRTVLANFCRGENSLAAHCQISPLIGIPLALLISCLLAELFGYWLHRLLHSDKIPFLSRGHLIHHFLIYGPGQPMRLDKYHDATEQRFSVGNVGLEWLVPSAMILAGLWATMRLVRVPLLTR
jgi:hypothetical protein